MTPRHFGELFCDKSLAPPVWILASEEFSSALKLLIFLKEEKTRLINIWGKTSENTLTWYRYLSKIRRFVNYLCMNLKKITLNYLIIPLLEYQTNWPSMSFTKKKHIYNFSLQLVVFLLVNSFEKPNDVLKW